MADEGEVVADLCGGTRYFIDPVPASFGGGTFAMSLGARMLVRRRS